MLDCYEWRHNSFLVLAYLYECLTVKAQVYADI